MHCGHGLVQAGKDRLVVAALDGEAQGLHALDADLGGGLIKQRVARKGRGRSGGYRMIVGYRVKDRAVFLLGFAKNERENIEDDELLSIRGVAQKWLAADAARIKKELELGNLQEINRDEESE